MKSIQFAVLFALFAASTVAAECEQEQEQEQPLKERWSISRPKVVYENNDLKTLALQYDISDFPHPENVQFQLMRGENCEVPLGQKNDYLQAELVFEEDPNSGSSGTRSVTMTFQVLDDKTNSPLFSTPEEEGKTPLLQFCNRLSLHTTKGMMVNWLDARLTVSLPKEEEPQQQQQQQQPVVLTVSSSAVESERMLRSSR
jgi:hypothetical protein